MHLMLYQLKKTRIRNISLFAGVFKALPGLPKPVAETFY